MRHERFGAGRSALVFGQQKFNLHQAGREFEPKAIKPTPGAIDLCLITLWPLERVMAHLAEQGVTVEEGRWRAPAPWVLSNRCIFATRTAI